MKNFYIAFLAIVLIVIHAQASLPPMLANMFFKDKFFIDSFFELHPDSHNFVDLCRIMNTLAIGNPGKVVVARPIKKLTMMVSHRVDAQQGDDCHIEMTRNGEVPWSSRTAAWKELVFKKVRFLRLRALLYQAWPNAPICANYLDEGDYLDDGSGYELIAQLRSGKEIPLCNVLRMNLQHVIIARKKRGALGG